MSMILNDAKHNECFDPFLTDFNWLVEAAGGKVHGWSVLKTNREYEVGGPIT